MDTSPSRPQRTADAVVPTPSRTYAPLHRHSVGSSRRMRDPGKPWSVHLSGGTLGRAEPPQHSCPAEAPYRAPSAPSAPRAQKKSPMYPPTPPSAADDDRRAAGTSTPPVRGGGGAVPGSTGDPRGPEPRFPGTGRPSAAPARGTPPSLAPPPSPRPPLAPPPTARRPAQLPPTHATLICVALPGLAISTEHGQLTGRGLEGFYRAGRRVLSRCRSAWPAGNRSRYRPG